VQSAEKAGSFSIVTRLFWRVILRQLPRHPMLALLGLLSIALGVAVVGAIHLANQSANNAFRQTVSLVAGEADLEIRGRIPDQLLPQVASVPGIRSATPAVEWIGLAPGIPGGYVRILGIDPFSSGTLRPFTLSAPDGGPPDLEAWLREPDAVAVFPAFMESGVAGDIIVQAPSGSKPLRVEFLLEPADSVDRGDPRLLAMDIAWAQEAGDLLGYLTSIQVELEQTANREEVAAALREILPGDVSVQTPLGRTRQTEGMLASFQLNLTALSMVSLLVGCYLIFNTVSASVVRRRTEIGVLRSLGTPTSWIRAIFLLEAAVVGFVGSVLGIVAALPLANILTGFVAQTISSLYVLMSIEKLAISPWMFVGGLLLGTGASVVSAWIPSREALDVDPREVLHPGHLEEKQAPLGVVWFWSGLGLLACAAATGWFALGQSWGVLGFAAAFLVVAGFSLLVPLLLRQLSALVARPLLNVSAPLSLGWQNLGRAIRRNSVTIAALAAALAMLVSISVMIHSFRGSVDSWMNRTLVADVFFAPAANEIAGTGQFLPPDLLKELESLADVAEIATFREIQIEFAEELSSLGIFSGRARGSFDFLGGNGGQKNAAMLQPRHVAVSESFATRFGIRDGAVITLPMPAGETGFTVAGVFRDYTRDSGTVMISLENYLAAGGENRPQSAGVFLQAGSAPAQVLSFLEAWSEKAVPLSIYENKELKKRVGEIFDQTFAVTGVLRLIAIVVAVTGVFFGLGILVNERAREIGVLRAIGASRPQVLRTVLAEAAGIGLAASVVGLLSGAGLSLVLTYVINKAFFGWSVDLSYPLDFLVWVPAWVISASILAALWPALRAASTRPAEALRYE
jgi:putative ABC transport system permease protein